MRPKWRKNCYRISLKVRSWWKVFLLWGKHVSNSPKNFETEHFFEFFFLELCSLCLCSTSIFHWKLNVRKNSLYWTAAKFVNILAINKEQFITLRKRFRRYLYNFRQIECYKLWEVEIDPMHRCNSSFVQKKQKEDEFHKHFPESKKKILSRYNLLRWKCYYLTFENFKKIFMTNIGQNFYSRSSGLLSTRNKAANTQHTFTIFATFCWWFINISNDRHGPPRRPTQQNN